MSDDLRVIIADTELNKLDSYCQCCPTEVAAMGYVTNTPEGDFYVDEVFLVPQVVGPTEVDFISEGLPYAVEKAIADNRINDLRFCWHSHVDMKAFFSGTDEDWIEKIRNSGPTPWFVSVVSNKKHEFNARLDVFGPGLALDGISHIRDIKLSVVRESQATGVDEQCIAEMEQFLTRKKYTGKAEGSKSGAGKQLQTKTSANGGMNGANTLEPISSSAATGQKAAWELTDKEWEVERDFAESMHMQAKRESWTGYGDNLGFTWWMDTHGAFKGSCLSDPDKRMTEEPKDYEGVIIGHAEEMEVE